MRLIQLVSRRKPRQSFRQCARNAVLRLAFWSCTKPPEGSSRSNQSRPEGSTADDSYSEQSHSCAESADGFINHNMEPGYTSDTSENTETEEDRVLREELHELTHEEQDGEVSFSYILHSFNTIQDPVVYSPWHVFRNFRWRFLIYPAGNLVDALSVYLQCGGPLHSENENDASPSISRTNSEVSASSTSIGDSPGSHWQSQAVTFWLHVVHPSNRNCTNAYVSNPAQEQENSQTGTAPMGLQLPHAPDNGSESGDSARAQQWVDTPHREPGDIVLSGSHDFREGDPQSGFRSVIPFRVLRRGCYADKNQNVIFKVRICLEDIVDDSVSNCSNDLIADNELSALSDDAMSSSDSPASHSIERTFVYVLENYPTSSRLKVCSRWHVFAQFSWRLVLVAPEGDLGNGYGVSAYLQCGGPVLSEPVERSPLGENFTIDYSSNLYTGDDQAKITAWRRPAKFWIHIVHPSDRRSVGLEAKTIQAEDNADIVAICNYTFNDIDNDWGFQDFVPLSVLRPGYYADDDMNVILRTRMQFND